VKRQALSEVEEKAIVRWGSELEEWGHAAILPLVKGMAEAIVQ